MHHRSSHPAWLALVLGLAACQSAATGRPLPTSLDHTVDLPPLAAAAIVGGALRCQLPFVDPVQSAAGVLVQLRAGQAPRLLLVHRGGKLAPVASHRVQLCPGRQPTDAPLCDLRELAPDERTAADNGMAAVAIEFQATAHGTRLVGQLPRALIHAVDQALALAADPTLALPGLGEPNLAVFAHHRLHLAIAAAERAHDDDSSRALRQRAARLRTTSASLHRALGTDALRSGDAKGAQDEFWCALLASDDPVQRSRSAAQLSTVMACADDPDSWRQRARSCLRGADSATAAGLVHLAARLAPHPAADYRLRSQIHRHGDDANAAMASVLLAREHAGLDIGIAAFAAELWPRPTGLAAASLTPPAAALPAAPAR